MHDRCIGAGHRTPLTRLRRASAVVAALALLAGACGGSKRPAASATGHDGSTTTSTEARRDSSAPTAPGASTTVPTGSAGTGQQAGTATSNAAPGSATATTLASTGPADAATAARRALDAYLDALVRQDEARLAASSTGAAAALGSIRLTIARVNASKGATTTVTTQGESFTASQTAPDRVVLAGSAQQQLTVSGPKGNATNTSTFSAVTVVNDGGAWKVADFEYDGQPMRYYPENATATANGTRLGVAFVLSYGAITGVVADLSSDAGQPATAVTAVTATSLTTTAKSASGTGDFTSDPKPTGFLRFPRDDAAPQRLDATFRRPDGTTTTFSVSLSA